MDFFFNPKSVAVIGASDKGPGLFLLKNLFKGYQGKIFPVNPSYNELQGLKCYPSVSTIPSDVDLALVLVPAKAAPDTIKSCVEKNVKGAIIQSAGFSEVGEKGIELSARCLKIAREGGLRLWGPNCMGFLDVPKSIFFTLMQPAITNIVNLKGVISIVVQSGMLSAGFLADLMSRHSIGVAKVCSLGNKLDVDECDVLEYLISDPDTKVIALYLESFSKGRRFLEIASSSHKPIVVLKGGKSETGARAALSHTASLAGDTRVTENMLAAAGVVEASDFHHMIDLARTLAAFPELPPDCKVAIISFSGGAGILSCDLIEKNQLQVADLTSSSIDRLSIIFPPWMPPSNPIDLFPAMAKIGRVPALEKAFEIIIDDPGVDAILFHHLVGVEPTEIDIAALKVEAEKAGKVVLFWSLGISSSLVNLKVEGHKHGIEIFNELSRAVECLACAAKWEPPPKDISINKWDFLSENIEISTTVLDEFESKNLLRNSELPLVKEFAVNTIEQAFEAAGQIGYPIVLKGLLPGVVHKTELGMVRLNIYGGDSLRLAASELLDNLKGKGKLLIQQQIKGDFEMIVGFLRDRQFGPLIMVGLGGVLAELQPDVVFAPAPLNEIQAKSLLGRIRNQKLLNGYRAMPPLELNKMVKLICRLSEFCSHNEKIKQVDLNPVIVENGIPTVVDASIVISK